MGKEHAPPFVFAPNKSPIPIIPDLPGLVHSRFKTAQLCGDLIFYETQVAIVNYNDIPFQIRFSPALANKPKSDKPNDRNKKPFDPFEAPPEGLHIVSDTLRFHNLILNKFPVIPDHFILATKEFKPQSDLDEKDLEAAYTCLKSYKREKQELFGFYNCGEHSGASQAHRHMQFLPVKSMRSGLPAGNTWSLLADSLSIRLDESRTKDPGLPFRIFWVNLVAYPNSQELFAHYKSLLASVIKTFNEAGILTSEVSYSLAMTNDVMVICPRRAAEGIPTKNSSGDSVGPISVNGTLLAGTLLAQSEIQWNTLRTDESKLKEILDYVGFKFPLELKKT